MSYNIQYRNPFAEHKTFIQKARVYITARNVGVMAYKSDNTKVKLDSVAFDNVEFVAGFWRVQNEFKQPTQVVRGKEFVLHKQLPKQENNHFVYYCASLVGNNCYGRYDTGMSDFVVAKYEVTGQTHWGYGRSIAEARAFLGIRLYDIYQDLIHTAALQGKSHA